ncbi:MAG: methylated-DNA--[protein]-cysteine S-methyltransferase [Chlorobi bacterium]|nr:methylated-DNA--[protein]-cysteine S-methyltransferase [Chlorobiota bacterium]
MIILFQQSEIGRIGIAEKDGSIANLCFPCDAVPAGAECGDTELLREAFGQLHAYLQGDIRVFDLPLDPAGTPFMRKVWRHVAAVPYGCTASYRDIAMAACRPKAWRAVGMANRRNPIPLFIPCHRIVGSDGKPTGYRGGIMLKQALIDLERCRYGPEFPDSFLPIP